MADSFADFAYECCGWVLTTSEPQEWLDIEDLYREEMNRGGSE